MTSKSDNKPNWGLLPEDVRKILKIRFWQNRTRLKKLLTDDAQFPIEIPLKPPRGNVTLENMNHFQLFISSWRDITATLNNQPHIADKNSINNAVIRAKVIWKHQNFRALAAQQIPTHLHIPGILALAHLIGIDEKQELYEWQSRISHVINSLKADVNSHNTRLKLTDDKKRLFAASVSCLNELENLSISDLDLLIDLIPQLKKSMGEGCYLRALPVVHVDTKFIENNLRLIQTIAAAAIDDTIESIGLMNWLDCKEKPKDWLLIKPLCEKSKEALGGIPLLRMSSETLLEFEMPSPNILVVENEQSCLSLNEIDDTIAISGGGKNLEFLKASWLINKNIGYWGDIDSEGFKILSEARSKCGVITPLLMDEATVEAFEARMVSEPDSIFKEPPGLTESESLLFNKLRDEKYSNKRLEQERLSGDYVRSILKGWTKIQ